MYVIFDINNLTPYKYYFNSSEWVRRPQWMLGVDIRGSTVGIVGFGGIGQTVAKRLSGFEVGQFLYCGHSKKPAADEIGAKFVSFEELVQQSDFIFIICPLTPETKHLFNAEVFSKMKPTSVLVNVARGPVVDQEALINALKSNTIFAAGLDVMYPEPLPSDDPLLNLPNCGKYFEYSQNVHKHKSIFSCNPSLGICYCKNQR